MTYEVQRREAMPLTLAVACAQASVRDIGQRVVDLLREVYAFLERSGVRQAGHNVVLYLDQEDRGLFMTEGGVPVEAGVEVAGPFEAAGRVKCSQTPGGAVASVVHVGPYQRLPEAHAAVRRWCQEQGHSIAGPNWEVYGDWTEDPAGLRTEVVYLLK
jgi:effector-binding domain-containing protein